LEQTPASDDETVGARGEASAGPRDRRVRSPTALDRELELEQGSLGVAGRVLDRDPGDPGRDRAAHIRLDSLRIDGESAFEIPVDRNLDAPADVLELVQPFIDRAAVIRVTARPCQSG